MVIFITIALVLVAIGIFVAVWLNEGHPALHAFGAVALVGALWAGTSLYTQSVGQASVIVDAGGTIAGSDATPGVGVKAPWQKRVEWDLFSQTVTFAGSGDNAPSYTGGRVNGGEVTTTAKGGTQAFVDVVVTYSLDGSKVTDLYTDYLSQERFTSQVVTPRILSTLRAVPSSYDPIPFRGEKRGEAQALILEQLNEQLNKFGVTVSQVDVQDVRYPENVETAIRGVEEAKQLEAKALAVQAEQAVKNQTLTDQAAAQAEANRLLAESLSPQILEQRRIEAMKEGTVYVVPQGSTPLVQVQPAP